MKPALFLDRDGTLIKDNGYIKDIKKVVFYPFTIDALRELQKKYLLFIVTNQAGVGKGHITRLLTGHGRKHYKELETLPTHSYSVYKSLRYFAKFIQN